MTITPGQFAALADPPPTCARCPRLASFRAVNAMAEPGWFNAPVPSFGAPDARLLIVGLAPGLRGANRTGRPFTGDFAGELLYGTLLEYGFASGTYRARPDDGLQLVGCMITNAIRCVPPENKPLPFEVAQCRDFLSARIASLPRLRAIVALGRIAHDQILAALAIRKASHPFAHASRHQIKDALVLFDSFHCSRYNTNTGRLTPDMFRAVFATVRTELAT